MKIFANPILSFSLELHVFTIIAAATLFINSGCDSGAISIDDTDPSVRCYEGDYIIQSDADMEAFQSWSCINGSLSIWRAEIQKLHLPSLAKVTGSLTITDNLKLLSLEGLDGLTEVSGSIEIGFNIALVDLKGLSSLRKVENDFRIYQNASLESLDGLKDLSARRILIVGNDSLASLEGMTDVSTETVYISSNPSLLSLTGLNDIYFKELAIVDNDALSRFGEFGSLNFSSVDGMRVEQNDALIDFQGMDNLELVNGEILVVANRSLTSLNGLDKLGRIRSNFAIKSNDSLLNLSGLGSLSDIDNNLTISRNIRLVDLTGIECLNIVGGNVVISWNPELVDLNGIVSIVSIDGLFPFQVMYNESLPQCLAFSVFEEIGTLEGPCIHDNFSDDACDNEISGCYPEEGFY
jgi:hypothetical protein